MNTTEFLDLYKNVNFAECAYIVRPRIICNDGFAMSVQAGATYYSRFTKTKSGYTYRDVEVRNPNMDEVLLRPYAENVEIWTMSNVYAFVPISVCDEIISKHGGTDEEAITKLENWRKFNRRLGIEKTYELWDKGKRHRISER